MNYNSDSGLPLGTKLKIGSGIALLLVAVISFFGLLGKNNDQDWQIVQYPTGAVRVVNTPGYYVRLFGTVTTYPRNWQVEYNNQPGGKDGDWSTKVTFNDGGYAHMDSIIRFASPTTEEQQRAFHRLFAGSEANVEAAVWAHLSDAMKSSAPVMSTSEHQSARRSEYNALVQEQLEKGLYEMRKTERKLDQKDEKGQNIIVVATEVVEKDGKPVITKPSPLTGFGIKITQFSITDVKYDEQTLKQFITKKEAFLAAENSKAQREKETQERLMVQEKGLREKAEAEAVANKQMATETINATREKTVAETNAAKLKIVAETQAAQLLAVAQKTKETAEVAAQQEKVVAELQAQRQLEVAKLERQAAEENAAKQIKLAEAQKKSLELGGAISEEKRVLAEIDRDTKIQVAEKLSKIAVPGIVINGGGTNGGNLTDNLVNLRLLQAAGVIPDTNSVPVVAPVPQVRR